jgi:hypothetical protein
MHASLKFAFIFTILKIKKILQKFPSKNQFRFLGYTYLFQERKRWNV